MTIIRMDRFLSLASAALLLATLVMVAWFYHNRATRDMVAIATEYNVSFDRILSNVLLPRHCEFLRAAPEMETEALRADPEIEAIDRQIRAAAEGANMLKVKIYSPGGRVIFSTDARDIGTWHPEHPVLLRSIELMRPVSKLSTEDSLTAISGELFNRDVVETYLPRIGPCGKLLAVFELYTDVTEIEDRVEETAVYLTLGLGVIFAVAYAILVAGIMRRAIAPVRRASRLAARIGPDNPGLRLPLASMPAEIAPLVTAVNAALDRLDRALESQRRFVADAAHELLTPLTLIRTELDLLGRSPEIVRLKGDVDSMTEMLRQLLYLSELEGRGRTDIAREEGDLAAVATDVVARLAPEAARRGREIVLCADDGPVTVQGAERVLQPILRNLVENALRHTPDGTAVEVGIRADGTVTVRDHGPGVPADRRASIFERFWRGDGQHGQDGAGLGLSIVRRLVEGLGGTVGVDDAPGGGAVFTVRLRPAGA